MAADDEGTKRDIGAAWARHKRRPGPAPQEPEPKRDILAEHFGEDWRTSFEFTPPPPPGEEPNDAGDGGDPHSMVEPADPYAVLGVAPNAPWERIVEAHRALARQNHPDQLHDATDDERAAAEERIRDINVAYRELRVRRGK